MLATKSLSSQENSLYSYLIFFLASIFLIYETVLQVSLSIVTHELMHDLKVNYLSIGVMSSFYFLGFTIMQIPGGILFDRGRLKIILSTACLVCAVGTCLFAYSQTLVFACITRFMIGTGSAFSYNGLLVIISRWFSSNRFDFLVGFVLLFVSFGAIGSEFLLSIFIKNCGWRISMTVLGFTGIFLAIILYIFSREDPAYHIRKSNETGVVRQLQKVLGNAQSFFCAFHVMLIWGTSLTFGVLWGIPFLVKKLNITTSLAALIMAFFWVSLAASGPLLGYCSNLFKRRKPFMILASTIGLISTSVLIYMPNISINVVCLSLVFMGFACSSQVLIFALAKDNNPQKYVGLAISFTSMLGTLGSTLFQTLSGYLLHSFSDGFKSSYAVPLYSYKDFQIGLLPLPIYFLLSIVVCNFFLKETLFSNRKLLPN